MIRRSGATPERLGLIGGRYKQLWRKARTARVEARLDKPTNEERQHLNRAIDSYTRGMELDFNVYYCSSNLPALLRERGLPADLERADAVEHFVVAACERARALGVGDEWLRPTLLGAAFRAGDVARAEQLALDVENEGAAVWKLDTTLSDLRTTIERSKGTEKGRQLQAVHDRLHTLIS